MSKRNFTLSILIVLTLLFSTTSHSKDVGGIISSDTTWTLDESPYLLTQSVLINEGVTLTIEPGVEVRIGDNLGIRVDGALIAQGTEEKMIVFTSAIGTTPGSWSAINFTDTSPDATFDDEGNYTDGCILEYCRINYGGGAGAMGVIQINDSSPFISHCEISSNEGSSAGGIWAQNASELRITDNTISENSGYGIYTSGGTITISNNTISGNSGGYGGGIYARGGTITVSNNTISGNSRSGIDTSGTATVSNNTISGNSGGIHFFGYTITISNNIISGNSGGDVGGIYAHGMLLETITITNNTISGNSGGDSGGIYATSDDSPITISNNIISGNSANGSSGVGGIRVYSSYDTTTVSNNTISDNIALENCLTSAIYLGGSFREVSVWKLESNLIINNHGGDEKRAIYVEKPNWTINQNAIYNNDVGYFLYYGGDAGTNLDATNNYWGTSDQNELLNRIYDFFDNSSLGIVNYIPFATELDQALPPLPLTGLTAEPITGGVNLTWNANDEELSGYKLYYSTAPGPPYTGKGANQGESPILLENVTSYELTGLVAGQTYHFALTAIDIEEKESAFSSEVSVAFPAPELTNITISPDTAAVEVERTYDFLVSGEDADGNTYPLLPTDVTWSATEDIGTMDGNGTFTATKPGTGRIKAVLNANTSVTDETGDITVPIPPPQIESVSPTHALAGQPVTITGKYFGSSQGESVVIFAGVTGEEPAVSWSDTSITVNVPPGSFSGPIIVSVDDKRSKGVPFTVDNPTTRIEDVRVTNLTSSSATISWSTDGSAIGTVSYGALASLGSSASEPTPGKTHWVRLVGLAPETTYYFEIATADLVDNNGGDYYSFKTPTIGSGNTYTVYGRVYKSSVDPAERAIVYLSLIRDEAQSSVLSTLTDSHGYWLLDLGDLKNPVYGDVWSWSVGDSIRIEVQAGEDGIGFDESHAVSGTSSQNVGEITLGTGVVRHISLPRGLSLITLPLTRSPAYASYALIGDIQTCDRVVRWQVDTQSWDSAVKTDGEVIGSDFEIKNGVGYFVQVNADTVWSLTGTRITFPITLSLVQGLNLIGTPATTGLSSYKLISSIPDCVKVARWNEEWQSWDTAIIVDDNIIGSNFPIKDNNGCFVQVNAEVEWTPPIAPAAPLTDAGNGASVSVRTYQPELLPLITDQPLGDILDSVVSNVTSSSVTLSWRLNGMGNGVVRYGETPVLENSSESRIHSALHAVRLTGLKPEATYYYRITSRNGSKEVSTSLLAFRTSKVGAGRTYSGYGKMLDYDGIPLAGKLIYLNVHGDENSLPLSCVTDSNGFWCFDLGNLKATSGEPFKYQPNDQICVGITPDKPMLTAKLEGYGVQFIGDVVIPKFVAHTAGSPEYNELLQNFPNPFNPETWIPFKLNNEGNATIKIYDLNGTLVKRLSLGYIKPGCYLSQNKAAYWGGRNELGETVASGIYFYELSTGDFRAVKKMVILR